MSACRECWGRGYCGVHYRVGDPCERCEGAGLVCDGVSAGPGEAPCPARPTVYVLGNDYCDAHAPDLLAARGATRPRYADDPEAGW